MIPTRHRYCALIGKGLIAVALGYGLLHAGTASAQTPSINLLLPSSTNAGGPAFTLTVTGTGYNTSSVVQWNGSSRVTSFFSSSTLEAQITSDDIATPGQVNVTVVNPGPPAVTSEAAVFTIKALLPTITSINPTAVAAGGTALLISVVPK